MNTTKRITLMNTDLVDFGKTTWANTVNNKAKFGRKKFIRVVKRAMAGPVFGFWLSFISIKFLGLHWSIGVILGLVITLSGLLQRFRYVKYSYLILVIMIYAFIIEQMIVH